MINSKRKKILLMAFLMVWTLSLGALGQNDSYIEGINACRDCRYKEAFQLFSEAVILYSARNDELNKGKALLELGKIMTIFCRLDDADSYYLQALKFVQSDKRILSETLLYAGINESLRGNYGSAQKYLEESLDIVNKMGIERAHILIKIGDLFFTQKKFNCAFRYYDNAKKSLALRDTFFVMALASDSLGEAYRNLANSQLALLNYQDAMKHANMLNDPFLKGRIYFHMGMLYEELGKDDDALKCYENSITCARELDGSLSLEEKLITNLPLVEVFERQISLLMEYGRDEEAYKYCQLAKEEEFLETLTREFPFNSRDFSTPSEIREERQISFEIRRLAAEKRDSRDTKKILELDGKIQNLKKTYETVFSKLELSNPVYCVLIKSRAYSVPEIVYSIDKNDAMIEYFIAGDKIYLWYTDKKEFQGYSVPLNRGELDADLNRSRRSDSRHTFPGIEHNPGKVVTKLFAPIQDKIERRKNVTIIPHRELVLFPFCTALTSDGSLFIRQHDISLCPSLTSWLVSSKTAGDTPDLLVIFALGNGGLKGAVVPENHEVPFWGQSHRFVPIPQSIREAEAIFPLFSPRILIKEGEMNRDRVVESIKRASLIHWSTNCAIDARNPFLSGIVLSDCVLSCGDLYRMNISSELAVVSQYEQMGIADEAGVISILRALLNSGSRSCIINPSYISDEIRVFFFSNLYSGLKQGMSVSRAVKLAQLKTIEKFPWSSEWVSFSLFTRRYTLSYSSQ